MCKFFITFSKFFKRLCWMFSPNRNFGDAIAVQDLKGIHVWNYFWCFPHPTKILAPPLYTVYYIYCIFMLSLVPPPNFYTWRTPCLGTQCWTHRTLVLLAKYENLRLASIQTFPRDAGASKDNCIFWNNWISQEFEPLTVNNEYRFYSHNSRGYYTEQVGKSSGY